MIIDWSSFSTFEECPAKWWEKYVAKRQKRWPPGQRSDALCLGSLVHEGLRRWQEDHLIEIPAAVIEEVTPTKETFELALELVWGYTRAYPSEQWPLVRCEEPLRFPLSPCPACLTCPFGNICNGCLWGLAKIDSYFYVPELTSIPSGIEGRDLTLTPGWWIHEYKTKSPFIPTGLYMQSWEMNLQASFQITALQHQIDSIGPHEFPEYPGNGKVEGVLINVLEKPRRHVPRRKCRTCDDSYEFTTWLPTGTGEYACPVCGGRQTLQPLKTNQPTIPPVYYRLAVHRTPEELSWHRRQMVAVGEEMIVMERGGLHSKPWNQKACVNLQWKRECEYFGPHKNFSSTTGDDGFQDVPDYRGLIQLEG